MLLIFIVFTLISLCVRASEQITSNLWLLGNYNYSIHGKIITSDAPAEIAIWNLNCAKNASGCNLPPNLTVTEGPSTLAYSYALHSDYHFKVACQLITAIPTANCALTLQSGSESNVKITGIGQGILNQVPITLAAEPTPAIPTQSSPSDSVGTIAINYSIPLPTGQVKNPSNSVTSLLGGENKPTQSYNITPVHSSSGSFISFEAWKIGFISIMATLLSGL
ncbi:hypothetical protein OnM2_023082 [Erysiphe neolycopersici]|uniref:Uncharacterized protein n=1 Tax=Erysiphe neolycopersici TaxID=212602 RepID=A0A420I1Z2_9PEZI|nr:hypothetical protein OnM2_023082 [Erysiphe neolycopersici]